MRGGHGARGQRAPGSARAAPRDQQSETQQLSTHTSGGLPMSFSLEHPLLFSGPSSHTHSFVPHCQPQPHLQYFPPCPHCPYFF